MANLLEPTREAPKSLHIKLDRLWLVREEDGAVTHTTTVRDPENPHIEYSATISLARSYMR